MYFICTKKAIFAKECVLDSLSSLRDAKLFKEFSGYTVSHGLIKHRLIFLKFRYRKIAKNLATGSFADRNLQIQIVFSLVFAMNLQSLITNRQKVGLR